MVSQAERMNQLQKEIAEASRKLTTMDAAQAASDRAAYLAPYLDTCKTMGWTSEHANRADNEGWRIWRHGIQGVTMEARLAQDFVEQQMDAGSEFHALAWSVHCALQIAVPNTQNQNRSDFLPAGLWRTLNTWT